MTAVKGLCSFGWIADATCGLAALSSTVVGWIAAMSYAPCISLGSVVTWSCAMLCAEIATNVELDDKAHANRGAFKAKLGDR